MYYQKEEGLHSKSEPSIDPTSMNDLFFWKIICLKCEIYGMKEALEYHRSGN